MRTPGIWEIFRSIYTLCEWHSLALGNMVASWITGSGAREAVWDGEGSQRIKNTETVMKVLGVA